MSKTFIVALGYSEGGIDAVKTFFDHTPHDQATYIILRHIPVAARSELHNILKKYSKLTIAEAEDNTTIRQDTIYIPPASSYITIKNNRFLLTPREYQTYPYNRTIDIFLESLAKDKEERSIAIIMSGAGNDGAEGVVQIKKAGGMVMVQKPDTCSHPDMPLNAIETGVVDYVLPPAEMPEMVIKHVNPILKNANEMERLRR